MIAGYLALLLATTPAERFERDLDCVLRRVSAAERAEIVNQAIGRPADYGHLALLDAQSRCEERYRYQSDSFREGNAHWGAVVLAAMAVILREGIGGRLDNAGIAPQLVDDWFIALPAEVRTMVQMEQAVRDSLIAHLLERGVSRAAIDASSAELEHYFGSLVVRARIDAGMDPLS